MAETPTTSDRRPKTDEARQRQRDGQYKGLLHAVQKRKADHSANYAPAFAHGQMAADFERSAEAAGETPEEVRGHLSLVDRTLLTLCGFFPRIGKALPGVESRSISDGPPTPGPSPPRGRGENRFEGSWERRVKNSGQSRLENSGESRVEDPVAWNGLPSPPWGRGAGGEGAVERGASQEPRLPVQTDASSPRAPKLVRALGLLLWRPLRLFRTQESWEQLAIYYRLQQVGRWRREHGDLTVERLEQFREYLQAVLDNWEYIVDRRLKRIEKRFWKVWRLYRALVGVVGLVFGSGDSGLGSRDSGLGVQNSGTQAGAPACSAADESPAANPETRDPSPETRPLIQFRGTPHHQQFHPAWPERLDELTPEAIANPFQSPSHTLKAQQKSAQAAAVKDPKEWQPHPHKPRLPEMGFHELPASNLLREPPERELRRLVREGSLIVPGSLEEFAALVEEALGSGPAGSLGARASRPHEGEKKGAGETPALPGYLHAFAESLWNRMHAFSARVGELRELLEATLLWQPHRFLPLWKKLLPVEYGYGAVDFFQRTHGPNREDIAWGDDETTLPWYECKLRPAERPRSEAEGRKVHAGELQHALRIWLHALWHALVPALRGSHKVTVALYDWAVSRFGIREEFLIWRPNLSLAQLESRQGRPEWAARVVTVTGKTWVKLSDGRMIEPEK